MIKAKNGDQTQFLEIKIEVRNEMVRHIRDRIIRNLEAIEKFLKLQEYDDICAGLYTYAVEEYGKTLFLNDKKHILPNNKEVKFRYTGHKSFRDHYHKFRLAHKKLPESCKKLHEGSFTKTFSQNSMSTDLIANVNARLTVFFADFQNKNSILQPPQVDRPLLVKAVEDFLIFMRK
jgi:hypothetical protein